MKKVLLFILIPINVSAMIASEHYFSAIRDSNIPEVRHLLESGISVNTTNKHGETGLWLACCLNNYECAEFLLTVPGIDVNTPSPTSSAKRFPLHVVCLTHAISEDIKKQLVIQLLQKGADPNCIDSYGCSPLQEIIERGGNASLIRPLVEAGANMGPCCKVTALWKAIYLRHFVQVEEFIRLDDPMVLHEGLDFFKERRELEAYEDYQRLKRLFVSKKIA